MTEQAQETAAPESQEQPKQEAPKQEQSKGRGFTQDDLNKIAANEKREGRTSREAELLESLGVSSVEEAQSALSAHREREEANRSEVEKAAKRAEKAEGKVAELSGYQERVERAETALTAYAATMRSGLPESLTGMLDRLAVVDQLEWLTEHRSEYLTKEESQPIRRAVDTSPRITPDNNATGRERLVNVFGQKYGT